MKQLGSQCNIIFCKRRGREINLYIHKKVDGPENVCVTGRGGQENMIFPMHNI